MPNPAFENYIANIPEARRQRFEKVYRELLRLFPDLRTGIRYKMPCFESGDSWVAIASQKSYLSIYTCDAESIKLFNSLCPEIQTGKGCINIRDNQNFPLTALSQVFQFVLGQKST